MRFFFGLAVMLNTLMAAPFLVVSAAAQTINLYNRLIDPLALARLDEPDFARTRQTYGLGLGIKPSDTDPGYWVCAEDTGAGVITHMFATARTPDSLTQYRLYVDGKLLRAAELDSFYANPLGQMRPPFDTIVGEARLCDVQIPYSHGFRLLYKSTDSRIFFNYGWRPLSSSVVLPPTGNLASTEILKEQSRAEEVYRDPAKLWAGFGGQDTIWSAQLMSGAVRTVLSLHGPAILREFKLAIDTYTVALDSVWLEFYYDGNSSPAFSAPLMALFGQSYDFRPLKSLPIVFSPDSGFVMRFAMPFVHSLQVRMRNSSGRTFSVTGSAIWRPYPVTRERYGYLHAHFEQTPRTQWGVAHHVFQTTGRGRYVGMLMGIHNLRNGAAYEGDPIFTIDSSDWYSFHYDGMEDYFNGAQYFSHGEFFTPFAGTSNLYANYYRFHYLDAINFTRSINLDFQHGSNNNCWEYYRTLAFWYEQPIRFWTNKDAVRSGSRLEISGASYAPNESIAIEIAALNSPTSYTTFATLTASSEGHFDTSIAITGALQGYYSIRIGSEVYPRPFFVHDSPTIQITTKPKPVIVQSNDTVSFSGEGYAPEDVLQARVGSVYAELHYSIDSLSQIRGFVVIPDQADGRYRLFLKSALSGAVGSDEWITTTRTLRFESENLYTTLSADSGTAACLNVSWLYNWDWSRNGIVEFHPRRKGDTLGLTFYVPINDTFVVYSRAGLGKQFGSYDIGLDGPIYRTLSGYRNSDVTPSDSLILGVFALNRGFHRMTYTYRGRSSANIDSELWSDYIELVPTTTRTQLGVRPIDSLPNFIVVPNPVHKRTLSLSWIDDSDSWSVIDVAGRTRLTRSGGDPNTPLDLDGLENGVYILRSAHGRSGRFVLER
jgi:hypothetical protein